MKNFLAFVGAAILVLGGLGLYLDWFSVTPQKVGPGQTRLQVDINQDKIGKDVQQGAQKGADKVQEVLDKNAQTRPADANPSDNGPLPPPPGKGNTQPVNQPAKPPASVKEPARNFILDGWLSGSKK